MVPGCADPSQVILRSKIDASSTFRTVFGLLNQGGGPAAASAASAYAGGGFAFDRPGFHLAAGAHLQETFPVDFDSTAPRVDQPARRNVAGQCWRRTLIERQRIGALAPAQPRSRPRDWPGRDRRRRSFRRSAHLGGKDGLAGVASCRAAGHRRLDQAGGGHLRGLMPRHSSPRSPAARGSSALQARAPAAQIELQHGSLAACHKGWHGGAAHDRRAPAQAPGLRTASQCPTRSACDHSWARASKGSLDRPLPGSREDHQFRVSGARTAGPPRAGLPSHRAQRAHRSEAGGSGTLGTAQGSRQGKLSPTGLPHADFQSCCQPCRRQGLAKIRADRPPLRAGVMSRMRQLSQPPAGSAPPASALQVPCNRYPQPERLANDPCLCPLRVPRPGALPSRPLCWQIGQMLKGRPVVGAGSRR